MVTERADIPVSEDSPVEGGITDITPTDESPDTGVVDTAPAADAVESQEQPVTQESPTPEQPQAQEQPEQVDQQSFGELRDQVRAQQEQLQYYNQLEQRAQIQQGADKYKQDLERQGYLPEQAAQAANERAQQEYQSSQLKSQAEQYRLFREGQHNAAIHFAKEYKLGLDDLNSLEKFNTPQEMESEAKGLSETRSMASELAELKQKQVPAQSFDDNQPSPSASGSENDLLDKYISGDTSPDVVAAAKRLMGI